jgi:hypothetical protein
MPEALADQRADVGTWAPKRRILACAAQGSGGGDEARLLALLSSFETEVVKIDKTARLRSFFGCLRRLRRGGFDLFVLEGTGVAAGCAAIIGSILFRRPFVLGSGDAVAPYLTARFPLGAPMFGLYERLLYRCCRGFIGWTPYLAGRALTLGARRAITVPGWAPFSPDPEELAARRSEIRRGFGIPDDAVVFGIAGALNWSRRYRYCYGMELVRAAARCRNPAHVLIVGDGTGADFLRADAGESLNRRVFLTGRVARSEIPFYLAAMDVGTLPQSVDKVGSFRFTTKLAEYRQAGLPYVTNQIPLAYDLDDGDLWRLPGAAPWSETFITALARLMDTLTPAQAAARRRPLSAIFERDAQIRRAAAFIGDMLDEIAGA